MTRTRATSQLLSGSKDVVRCDAACACCSCRVLHRKRSCRPLQLRHTACARPHCSITNCDSNSRQCVCCSKVESLPRCRAGSKRYIHSHVAVNGCSRHQHESGHHISSASSCMRDVTAAAHLPVLANFAMTVMSIDSHEMNSYRVMTPTCCSIGVRLELTVSLRRHSVHRPSGASEAGRHDPHTSNASSLGES